MDLLPLKDCYLNKEEITSIVVSVGNRTDRKKPGTQFRLVWGLPPRYRFMNRPLDQTKMQSDDPQVIASYLSEQVVLFRKDIEKRILEIDGRIEPNITLNIIIQIRRGTRTEVCTNFNYPLSGSNPNNPVNSYRP